MILDEKNLIDYVKKAKEKSQIERFYEGHKVENEELKIVLDDRPTQEISKNSLGEYLIDYYNRCAFLKEILDLDPSYELKQFIKFLNGKTDEIAIYHYSFFPLKMNISDLRINSYSLHSLDKVKFQLLLKTHPFFAQGILSKNVHEDYRSLFISKIIAKRRDENESRHVWFDRLDEIYTYHHIIRFLLDFQFGEINHAHSSMSTDNFPHANWSGSSNLRPTEINIINGDYIEWIKVIIDFLEDKLYYRLILRGEIDCKTIFDRAIFLRSILDPFFEKNSKEINNVTRNGVKKSEIQSAFILKIINQSDSKYKNQLDQSELARFLQIRNSIIHPDPTDGIQELHFLYDKMSKIRKVIYDFIFTAIQLSKNKNLEDFAIEF